MKFLGDRNYQRNVVFETNKNTENCKDITESRGGEESELEEGQAR